MGISAYVALGSNLGDRADYLQRALDLLREQPRVQVVRVSSILETDPVGGPPGQGAYLNAAAELTTNFEPQELLRLFLDVEQRLGRVRAERNGPRTIDLDLLLYGDRTVESPELTIPHPRMHERLFVLQPLAEIAPNVVHPELGRTISELLSDLATPTPTTDPNPALAGNRELTGLRALVTGSTSGIGHAIALEFARAGADVIVHGRRSRQTADAVCESIQDLGRSSAILMADLRDDDACRHLADAAWSLWDGLDILVNNAGADTLTGEASKWLFEKKLEELFAVDVRATVTLSRLIGARMHSGNGGVILNMGWDQADTGMEGDSGQLFAATKAAVIAFSKSLALTLAPTVRVNCLAPGWVQTRWGELASDQWQSRVLRETPLHRWGRPEDVAATARWLASPAAAFITGQVIRVNGGAVR